MEAAGPPVCENARPDVGLQSAVGLRPVDGCHDAPRARGGGGACAGGDGDGDGDGGPADCVKICKMVRGVLESALTVHAKLE